MYLESITISGFKSFPQRTIIKLHPGINCIIGPNGCGKSNIIDAIRWALGESKTSLLRVKSMDELIFHGTESRPPKGMAHVSLKFFNNGVLPISSSEVVVSKRLHRSGENECTVNGKKVLHRDVIDLFESKNPQGYSLLSREEINSVLSGDPYYRRRTVEEIAGISTYRNHKLNTLVRLQRIKTDIEKLEGLISDVSAREIKLRSEAKRSARYGNLIAEVGYLRWMLIENKRNQIKEKSKIVSSLILEEKSITTRIKEVEKSITSIVSWRREEEKSGREVGNKMVMLEKQESSLSEKRESLRERLSEIVKEKGRITRELVEVGKTKSNIEDRYRKSLSLLETKKSKLNSLPGWDRSLHERREKIAKEIEALQKDETSVKENLIVTRTMIGSNKMKKEKVRSELRKVREREEDAVRELEEATQLYENLQPPPRDVKELRTSLRMLEEQRARLLTYMKDAVSDEGFVKLGSVITPKKGKERIVYGALGSILSCIVVNKLEDIYFYDGTRREFITPELLYSFDPDTNYKDLSSFVDVKTGYEHIASILRRFVVTSDIESAIALRRKGVVLPIVTQNGELLTHLGILEVGEPEVKLGKSRLERELADIKREIEEKRNTLNKRQSERIDHERERALLDVRIKNLKRTVDEMNKTIRSLEEELKRDIELDTESAEKTLLHLRGLIEKKEEERKRIDDEISNRSRIIEERRKVEEEISTHENELRFLKREIEGIDKNLYEMRRNLSATIEKERGLRQTLNEIGTSYKRVTEELENLRKEAEERYNKQPPKGVSELFGLEREIERARHSLDSLRENRHSLEIEIARLETQTAELRSIGVKRPNESYQVDNVEERLKDYERKIQSMQPVNPLAVKEHTEINERLKFLKDEREDIQRTRNIIEETIKLLDEQARNKVRDATVKINEKFNDIFKTLFHSGGARLVLGSGDPLESDIDIVVSPGGKKLRRIEQLSTGEKTLSVIALFFGIYELRPTPFMILDEVDAPLDDANLLRFLSIIKKRAETGQFILITHNRQTMESANYLYGVTMEVPGVSKIISVRLKK
jgi:chromosome segregation protein